MLLLAIALIIWLCVAAFIHDGAHTVVAPDALAGDTVADVVADITVTDSIVADKNAADDTIAAVQTSEHDTVIGKRSRIRKPDRERQPVSTREHLNEPIGE